jgi:hypothetical protein
MDPDDLRAIDHVQTAIKEMGQEMTQFRNHFERIILVVEKITHKIQENEVKQMQQQPINLINEEKDSLTWGTPSKGGEKKVYGDVEKMPEMFGKKIARMNLAASYAMGEIPYDKYLEEMKRYA